MSLGITDAACGDQAQNLCFCICGKLRAFLQWACFYKLPLQKAPVAHRCPQTRVRATLREHCSELCFLNGAPFPCMQMNGCRLLLLHEALLYFGDKSPLALINHPLCLSMDLLAPNFSGGKKDRQIQTPPRTPCSHPSGQGGRAP